MLLSIVQRLVFYGVLFLLARAAVDFFAVALTGGQVSSLFSLFSFLLGIIQTSNLWILNKMGEFRNLKGLNFWVKRRVASKEEARREVVKARAIVGWIFALSTMFYSSYLGLTHTETVGTWSLAYLILGALVASITVIITVLDVFRLDRELSLLHRLSQEAEDRKKTLEASNSDSK